MSVFRSWFSCGPVLNLLAGAYCVGSTAAYGIVSLPLAVRFLGKEDLGLWNLVSQTTAYLLWLDIGVANMAGRTLAEPFHRGGQREINSAWSSLQVILGVQSLLIAVIGFALVPWFLSFFRIPEARIEDARFVFVGSVALAAAGLPLRAAAGVFLCQNRFHWASITQGTIPWINLGVFGLFLSMGFGVRSFVFALALVTLVQWIWIGRLTAAGTPRPQFKPSLASRREAGRVLAYSSSMVLWGIAPVALAGLPAVVLGRQAGLDQVSIYHVTSRIPVMLASLAGRTYHSFYPALQRAFVAGDHTRFASLFRLSTVLSVWITGLCLFTAWWINEDLVAILAKPDFFGGAALTAWICAGLFVVALAEHSGTLFQYSGRPRWVSPVLALEIMVTAAIAFPLSQWLGPVGIAASLALVPLLVRLPYFSIDGPRVCGFGFRELCGPAFLAFAGIVLSGAACYLAATMDAGSGHAWPIGLLFAGLVTAALSGFKCRDDVRLLRRASSRV